MKIISLVNSKGGVGKTTLCVNLAREMQIHLKSKEQEGLRANVLLVDADPQGSLRDWHEVGGHHYMEIIALDTKSSLRDLRVIAQYCDYVFIDTPGKGSEIIASAITQSDLVLVPVQPSYYDIWAAAEVVDLIQQRQLIANGRPEAAFILNRCIPNTLISKEAKEYLHKSAFPYLSKEVHQRVTFVETTANGNTVFETSNQQAIDSIKMIGEEIRGIIKDVV